MIKKLFLLIILAVLIQNLQAQRPGGGGPNASQMPPDGILKGLIIDAESGVPMEYANVVIFSMRDSTIVAGTVTGSDGSFILEKVPFGRFYVVANFIGFDKLTINEVKITPKEKVVDLGQIKLEASTASLEGVEISAEKQHVEYKIDKKVVNVSQDVMAQGGTAVTALENTPSVQVDIEGNVSVRGSSSFTVLIDGRPSVLTGSEALQQIPASNIEKIEIITNPSAKYDPDGVAGIINVIMKEQKQRGFNGVANASIGSGDKYSADFLLNYRLSKFNFFGGMDYRDYNFGGSRESKQETFLNDTTDFRYSTGSRTHNRGGYGFQAGADYFISKATTLSVIGRLGNYKFDGGSESNLHLFTEPFTNDQYKYTSGISKRDGGYFSGNVNFQHKFDDLGQQLDANVFYSKRSGDDTEDQDEYFTDSAWNQIDDEPYFVRTSEESEESEFRLKIDYTKPVGENGKVEAGFQSRIENETEDYHFMDFDYTSGEFVNNPLYTNKMDFSDNVHSLYGIYSNTINNFGYQLGLRGEYTYRSIKNDQSPEPSVIDKMDYFPTIHLSQKLNNDDQILASYTRRIQRPGGRELDPFISYMDAYNVRQGNPDLQPEYTDSYELSYQKSVLGAFITLEGYYRVTTGKITNIQRLQDDGIMMNTFDNLTSDFSLGAELMISSEITKWMELSLVGNLYNYRLDGSIDDEVVDQSSTNWNSRFNGTFRLPEQFRLQLSSQYNGPSVTAQGESEGFWTANLALRKEFFNRKLSATASVRDMFKTAKRATTSSGIGFYSFDEFQREAPVFMLNLSYKINNYKQKQEKRNGEDGGGDSEMDDSF
jgi:outer membrane receptor protein involved in Fe transport